MNSSVDISHFKDWRLILDGDNNDGFYNMSIDEALLYNIEEGISPPALRIYGWERPAVTIGYGQDVESSINVDYCLHNGIDIVRRITGGRGILHQKELTYSIVAPKIIFSDNSISGIYTVIKESLRKALSSLFIPVDISNDKKRGPGGGACFGAAYRHEICIGGKKIMGGALRRLRNSFLYHGSILLERDSEGLAKALYFDSDEEERKYVESLNRSVIGINNILDTPLVRQDIEGAIVESLGRELGIEFYCGAITDSEEMLVSKLVIEKRELMSNIGLKRQ